MMIPSSESSMRRSKRPRRASDDVYMTGDASSPTAAAKPSQPPNSYKCDICDKAFSSHQALGGHKASHRIKSTMDSASTSAAAAEASNFASGPHPRGGCHQCSTCGKRFTTGQALGGHMRKHYVGVLAHNIGANSSDCGNGDGRSGVTSSSDSATVSCSGGNGDLTPLNVDLNSYPELDLTLKL